LHPNIFGYSPKDQSWLKKYIRQTLIKKASIIENSTRGSSLASRMKSNCIMPTTTLQNSLSTAKHEMQISKSFELRQAPKTDLMTKSFAVRYQIDENNHNHRDRDRPRGFNSKTSGRARITSSRHA
jgi:hypothetical protein